MKLIPRHLPSCTLALAAIAFTAAFGCNKKADNTANYTAAINTFYSAHPVCLFDSPKQLPTQADTSGSSKTSQYDALVDQGLLTRSSTEKKVFLVASKQVNLYDLSDKGRSAWTANPNQPGYGNFCYGHRKVSAIDSASPTSADPGATTQIAYRYTIDGAPAWATNAETQNAYPALQTDLSGPHSAVAILTNTSNGWQLTSAPGSSSNRTPATNADGQIVK